MTQDAAKTVPATCRNDSSRLIPLALIVLALIAGLQLWIATAGWAAWHLDGKYISQLADAFDRGQLSLTTSPPREMLALPDPYDPDANRIYRLHDALLFDGKYYLYWGPAPALLLAAACKAIGLTPNVGDQYLVVAFALGMIVAASILIFQAKSRFFPELGIAAMAVPVLSLALGPPVLFTLARPAIYEAVIYAGQFFLLCGFCAAFRGICRLPDHRALAARWLTAAGILWGLCIGSRMNLIPGVAIAVAITVFILLRGRRRSIPAAMGLLIPFLASIALLGWYNQARFHSFTDFGLHWQLTAAYNEHAQPPGDLFQIRYLPVDAYCYLLAPPAWMTNFPFVYAVERWPPFAHWLHLPGAFRIETVIGLAWTQPIFIFIILGAAALRWRKAKSKDAPGDLPAGNSPAIWLTSSLCAAGLIGFVPVLLYEYVTTRYLLDAVPSLTILAALGYWRFLAALSPAHRKTAARAAAVLVGVQSLMGLLLAMTGYSGNLQFYNPALYHAMQVLFRGW